MVKYKQSFNRETNKKTPKYIVGFPSKNTDAVTACPCKTIPLRPFLCKACQLQVSHNCK